MLLDFQWCGAAIVFTLPTLLWRGTPLPEKPSGKSDDLDGLDYDDNELYDDDEYSKKDGCQP
jgi:hypothetical protein